MKARLIVLGAVGAIGAAGAWVSWLVLASAGAAETAAGPAATEEPGYLVKTELTYESGQRGVKSTQELVIPRNSRNWAALSGATNGVVLLGRVARSDEAGIEMEYILVETGGTPVVISTPGIRARLGEKAEIALNTGGAKVWVGLLAKKASFRKAN